MVANPYTSWGRLNIYNKNFFPFLLLRLAFTIKICVWQLKICKTRPFEYFQMLKSVKEKKKKSLLFVEWLERLVGADHTIGIFHREDDECLPILTPIPSRNLQAYFLLHGYTPPIKLNIEFSSNYSAASSSFILAIAAAGLRPLGQVLEPKHHVIETMRYWGEKNSTRTEESQ